MNSHTQPQLEARRTPACAAYDEILPVLDEPSANRRLVAQAREHLATCGYCQTQRAHYARVDTLLRSAYAPDAMPLLRLDDVIGKTNARKEMSTMEHEPTPSLATQFVMDSEVEETPSHHQPPTPIRLQGRRWLSLLATAAAILVIGVIILTLIAAQARFRSSPAAPANTLPPYNTFQSIDSVSMVSANDGWAMERESPLIKGHTLDDRVFTITLLHYRQGRWSPTQSFQRPSAQVFCPVPGNQSVSLDSLTDGWATMPASSVPPAGSVNGVRDAMLHYDGHAWREVALPKNYQMCEVKMLSPTVGWAFGYKSSGNGFGVAIMAYDGHSWREQPIDSAALTGENAIQRMEGMAYALSIVSSNDAWALAQTIVYKTQVSVILHYHAGVWEQQNIFSNIEMLSFSFDTSDDGWMVGVTFSVTSSGVSVEHAVFVHYHAGIWTIIPHAVAPQIVPTKVVMVSPTDGWALADHFTVADFFTDVLLHYDGKQWDEVAHLQIKGRDSLNYFTLSVVGADDVWIGGQALWPAGMRYPRYSYVGGGLSGLSTPPTTALLLRYHNDAWQTLLS